MLVFGSDCGVSCRYTEINKLVHIKREREKNAVLLISIFARLEKTKTLEQRMDGECVELSQWSV